MCNGAKRVSTQAWSGVTCVCAPTDALEAPLCTTYPLGLYLSVQQELGGLETICTNGGLKPVIARGTWVIGYLGTVLGNWVPAGTQ